MKSLALALGLVTSLWLGAHSALPAQDTEQSPDVIAVPEELQNFSGMMIGKLVERDIERGSFTVTVDYVARVWENNKSRNPRAAVGKTLRVEGVTGEWLDPDQAEEARCLELEYVREMGYIATYPCQNVWPRLERNPLGSGGSVR